jgi:hypothetical protein
MNPVTSYGSEPEDCWLDEERAYAVVTVPGAVERPERRGLSHAQATTVAEMLRQKGHVAVVIHVVGEEGYEVDRYPAR